MECNTSGCLHLNREKDNYFCRLTGKKLTFTQKYRPKWCPIYYKGFVNKNGFAINEIVILNVIKSFKETVNNFYDSSKKEKYGYRMILKYIKPNIYLMIYKGKKYIKGILLDKTNHFQLFDEFLKERKKELEKELKMFNKKENENG